LKCPNPRNDSSDVVTSDPAGKDVSVQVPEVGT
jgi:hypothetical protein